MSEQRTDFIQETESFEAFDLVTNALEKIDSYAVSKNVKVLQEADDSLTEALADGVDPNYLKARYFRAMVRYLQGKPRDALSQFEQMGRVNPESALGKEVSYNIAAAYSALRDWNNAISGFREVIKITQSDSEVRLLARAGLAMSYAGHIGEIRRRLTELEEQESGAAIASRKRNEQRVKRYFVLIERQYRRAQSDAQKVSDQRVVEESEQIFRESYAEVEGQRADRLIELVPAAPKKRRRIFNRRLIIVLIVLLIVGLVLVELWVGWDVLL